MIGERPEENAPRSRPGWLVFAGVAVAVLAVGLGAFALAGGQTAAARYADRIPAGAVMYLEMDVAQLASPETREVVEAFGPLIEAGTGEDFDIDAVVEEMLASWDEDLASEDLAYETDVASWATGPVAVGVYPADDDANLAVVLGGDDATALDSLLEKMSSKADGTRDVGGVEFLEVANGLEGVPILVGRVQNDLVAVSSVELAESIIDGPGESLAADEGFSVQVGRLPGDQIALFALDGDAAAELGEPLSTPSMMGFGAGQELPPGWTAGAFAIDDGNLRMDSVSNAGGTFPVPVADPLVEQAIPAETIAFLRMGSFFDQLGEVVDPQVFGGMEQAYGMTIAEVLGLFSEDGAVAVWPSTDPEIPVNAAVVGLSDSNQSAVVDKLAGLAAMMGWQATPTEEGHRFGGLVDLGTRDALTILTTRPALIDAAPDASFADGDLHRRASSLVDGDLQVALDVPAIVDLVDGLVAADDPEAAEMLQCLPFGVVAGATNAAGDVIRASVVVEITPRC